MLAVASYAAYIFMFIYVSHYNQHVSFVPSCHTLSFEGEVSNYLTNQPLNLEQIRLDRVEWLSWETSVDKDF